MKTKLHHLAWLTLGVLQLACGQSENPGILSRLVQQQPLSEEVAAIIEAIDAADTIQLAALLEGGANPTPPGSPLSPLNRAIEHFQEGQLFCDATSLGLLLEHGADPDFVDYFSGISALGDALAMGDVTCAELLKSAGADVSYGGQTGQSTLQFAVKGAIRTADMEILRLVLSWGIDPNSLSAGRKLNAFHEAVYVNSGQADAIAAVIDELLRNGADPCLRDADGRTALDLAVLFDHSLAITNPLRDAMQECSWE